MKKQFTLFAAALVLSLTAFTTANAQTAFKKADKFVEGTASYSKSTGVDATYGIRPTIGYMVTSRFALGVFGEASKNETDKNLNLGVFARCYCLSVGKNLQAYSQLDLASVSVTDIATDVKASAFNANLGLGANYFVTPRLALTANLTNLVSYTSQDSNSDFTVGFNGISNVLNDTKFGILYRF